ncbi:MAG: hypothetical protein GY754_34795 [bacterium]|nr:hypothetical protein [bacterium]
MKTAIKKRFLLAWLLSVMLIIVHCTTTPLRQGWADNETYIISAEGSPSPGVTGTADMKKSAKENALVNAQKMFKEKILGFHYEGASFSGKDPLEKMRAAIERDFDAVSKSGEIIRESFDEKNNCRIMYRVKSSNLRKRVERLNWFE